LLNKDEARRIAVNCWHLRKPRWQFDHLR
jgi:hypothetical protein